MDHPFLSPYLDSVVDPNFQTGCNFATGGSTVLPANQYSRSPFSFGIQVAQFIRFKARVLELLAKGISQLLHLTSTSSQARPSIHDFRLEMVPHQSALFWGQNA